MRLMEALSNLPDPKIIIATKSGMQYKGMRAGGIYKRNVMKSESWHWVNSLKLSELLDYLTNDEQILGERDV